MPISGSGGLAGSSGIVPTTKGPAEATPAATAAPPAAPTGWTMAGSAPRPPKLELVPQPRASLDELPNPVQAQVRTALDRYQARVEAALHHDALSMARGIKPVREGDALTPQQQTELDDATQDLLLDLPMGALAPELAAKAQRSLEARGLGTRDLPSAKLRDLGTVASDLAKDQVKELKANSPKTYYGIAAGLAAAAGLVAWNQGSEKLARLGVKPEVSTKLFDDQLKVKLKGEWQAHFQDFKGTAELQGKVSLGDAGRLTGSASANTADGFERAALGYTLDRPDFNLSANATFNRDGVETVSGSATWRPRDDFSLSASASHNFQTDSSSATAEARWRLSKDVDLAVSGRSNFAGDHAVGAGVTIRF